MLSKAAIALPLAAALLEQTSAFSFQRHRHLHEVEKRAVVYETVYHTVYATVTAPNPSTETPQLFVANNQPPAPAAAPAPPAVQQAPPAVQQALPAAPAPPPVQQAPAAPAPPPAAPAPPASKAQDMPLAMAQADPSSAQPISSSKTSTTSSSPSLAKRGIAYNDAGMANSFKKACGNKCGWAYNWGADPGNLDTSMVYIPLLWGDLPQHTARWSEKAEAAISKGSPALLSFNEPDMVSQSNMSPQRAATSHATNMYPFVGRALIGSPAVTNSEKSDQGVSYLKAFMDECEKTSNCHVDFCAVHWYSPASAIETLFTHLKQAHEACKGKPIKLTEFAPFGTDEEIAEFLKKAIPRLESLDYLDGYSYFMVAQPQLMNSATSLNEHGNIYAALTV